MAKDKKKTVSGIINQMRNTNESRYLLTQDEIDKLDRGVPLKGMLPLQAIMRTNVIPLHNFMTVTGVHDVGKSNLIWEMARVWIEHGGIVSYIGIETNENVEKQKRILHNPNYMDNVLYYKNTNHIDTMRDVIIEVNEKLAEVDPQGDIPLLILLDSLGHITKDGKLEGMKPKDQEKVKEGNNMDGAHSSKKIKKFLNMLQVNYLNDRPVTFIVINHKHEKIQTGFSMGKSYYNPGGKYKDYLNCAVLDMVRIGKNSSVTSNQTFFVKMRNTKQACGPARKIDIEVPFTDWDITLPDHEEPIAVCGFDWDTSLVKLLLSDYTSKTQLKEIINITKKGKTYNCKELELEGVSDKELGEAIHNNEEIVSKLQKLYTISNYYEIPKVE